jgi:hypothetical protein
VRSRSTELVAPVLGSSRSSLVPADAEQWVVRARSGARCQTVPQPQADPMELNVGMTYDLSIV